MKKVRFTTSTYLFIAVFIMLTGTISMQIVAKIQLDKAVSDLNNRVEKLDIYCKGISSDIRTTNNRINTISNQVDALSSSNEKAKMIALEARVDMMEKDLIARIENIDILSAADGYVCAAFGACGR